ncbi:MAG: response regulator [Oscillatoriales cyanobacterium C42_A2020_001]|nr:response regulator [Leptolyngbyaceae cyanobacterium C42_A2020_001]
MQPDQQQRIMGYFIEEAKDHLNTIEQGLLNLQSTIEDPEMVNEVFRAAHSVKGGAAMLGLNSIQQVSHRLEDFFKILKETPVRIDQKLENLFLRAFDALQELLGQLQGPFGLTEDAANTILTGVEPTFEELEQHLNQLAGTAGLPQLSIPVTSSFNLDDEPDTIAVDEALQQIFRNDVPVRLRDMLQLFKQPETDPITRQQLQELCRSLGSVGEQYGLTTWCHLVETARRAIAHSDNSYRILAPIVIKDIKLGQELILAGRAAEISPCDQLQALVPIAVPSAETMIQDDFADLLADIGEGSLLYESTPSDELVFEELAAASTDLNLGSEFDSPLTIEDLEVHQGPEVGTAELNSLADLFEGELPDLGLTWQQEEVIGEGSDLLITDASLDNLDDSSDFSDLLFEESSPQTPTTGFGESDDLNDLFGDDLLEDDTSEVASAGASTDPTDLGLDDFEDLLEISDSSSLSTGNADLDLDAIAEELPGFAMGTDDLNLDELDTRDSNIAPKRGSKGIELEGALDDLGDLFDGLNDGDLGSAQAQESPLDSAIPDPWSESTFNSTETSLDSLNLDSVDVADSVPEEPATDALTFDDLNLEDTASGEAASLDLDFGDFPTIEPVDEPEGLEFLSGDASDDALEDLLALNNQSSSADSEVNASIESALFDEISTALDATELPPVDATDSIPTTPSENIPDPWADENTEQLTAAPSPSSDLEIPEFSSDADLAALENLDLADLGFDELPADSLDFSDLPPGESSLPTETTSDSEEDFAFSGLFESESTPSLDLLEFEETDQIDLGEAIDAGLDSSEPFDSALFNNDLGLDVAEQPGLNLEASNLDEETLWGHELSEIENLTSTESSTEVSDDLADLLDEDIFNFDTASTNSTNSLSDNTNLISQEELSDIDDLLGIGNDSPAMGEEITFSENLFGSDSFELESPESEPFESTSFDLDDLLHQDSAAETPSTELDDLLSDDSLFAAELPPTSEPEEEVISNTLDLTADAPTADNLVQDDLSASDLIPDSSAADEMAVDDLVVDEIAVDDLLGTDDFGDLDALLDETPQQNELAEPTAFTDRVFEESFAADEEFAELDTLLNEPATSDFSELNVLDELLDTDLASTEFGAADESATIHDIDEENLLGEDQLSDATNTLGDFSDLEALLDNDPTTDQPLDAVTSSSPNDSEFDDLDVLLKDAEEKMGGSPSVKVGRGVTPPSRRTTRPGRVFSEQTMRVPVKHLDNLSNLVGELVVNRNSLEQDQERLRQSLDNLLYQVQQLSDVGQRMQDLYERSLLESSLLASRQGYRVSALPMGSRETTVIEPEVDESNGIEYDPLEMDRFTGFHSLSQEMIELIVRVRESSSDIEFIVDETEQVTRMFRQVTTQLQEGLTRSRMVPFAQTADRLPRAVRDISMKVGKQAELVIEGRETLIDKMILEQLYDPMTHLVNNAITHGIEPPSVRAALGKPPAGRITIRAFHQGNQTIISVSDDGAGIDVERVKAKAIEKGLITQADARVMTRLDVYDILFHPGFSTKDQADDFSGRGVGMDVVRTSLSEIRGVINTDSNPAKGTTFTIRLPLTLSISKALCCISDRARIAFPMDGVEDMVDVPKERIQTSAEGQPCIAWRDTILPVRPLAELLGYNRHLSRGNVYGGNQEDDIMSIVVLRSAGNFLALQVDQVLGEQEIVIKQLEGPVPKPVGVAGATVLGDGRIMPIADVLELIDLSMGRIRRDAGGSLWDQGGLTPLQEPPAGKTEPMVLIVDDSITVRELLSMTFNKVGYRVEQARDGQEAWEKLRSGLPCDIVFCDIEMPRMDGLELLSRIQKDANLKQLPIAMLTSRGADRHRQMAASLGASGYFTKPYLEEALLDAAQRMLRGERLLNT